MPTENRSSTTNGVSELLPCPFCKAAMRIESNRDWHRVMGDHDEECVFLDPETMTVPATDEQRELLVRDWNRRKQPAEQHQREPVAAFENCIDARAYIVSLFNQRLRRHDFNQYITERLAGDFAFALANWMAGGGISDAGEVERLRGLVKSHEEIAESHADACAEALTRLVERDALLKNAEKAIEMFMPNVGKCFGIDFALLNETLAGLRAALECKQA